MSNHVNLFRLSRLQRKQTQIREAKEDWAMTGYEEDQRRFIQALEKQFTEDERQELEQLLHHLKQEELNEHQLS